MDYLTIKELVLEIVEELLSSEENLQELWFTRRRNSIPTRKRKRPQQVDRHKYVNQSKLFAGRGGLQVDARYVHRGAPETNPSIFNIVKPPHR